MCPRWRRRACRAFICNRGAVSPGRQICNPNLASALNVAFGKVLNDPEVCARLAKEQAATVRAAEPGCLFYTPYRSLEDPEGFLSYEVYQDQAAMDFHMSASHLAAYRKKRQDLGLVEGPPDIQVLRS